METVLNPQSGSILDLVVQNSRDGILAFDRECRYTVWNAGMERISGITASQAIGQQAFELFPFLRVIGEDQYFLKALEGQESLTRIRPFHVPSSGRSGFFEATYSPMRDARGKIVGGVAVIRDITERVQSEANEQMFQSIAESIPQIVWITNQALEVSYFNQRWYEYTGLDSGKIAQSYMDFVHPDDRAGVLEKAAQARESGKPFEAEYRLRSKDGGYRWFLGRGIAIQGADGTIIRRIGTATDIHDQRIANERFRALVEQTPYAFQLYSPDGLCIYANPAWERFWHSKREELHDYNIRKDPQSLEHGVRDLIERAFAGECITLPDVHYDPAKIGKLGRPRWIRVHFFPIKIASSEVTQVAEVLEDVTDSRTFVDTLQKHVDELQRTEQELKQHRDRERFLSEASKLLASSLEPGTTIETIADYCVRGLSDFCIIDLIGPDRSVRRAAVRAADPQVQALARKIAEHRPSEPSADHPIFRALKSLRTVHLPRFDGQWLRKSGLEPEHQALILETKPVSLVSVPLVARGAALGVLTVVSTERSKRVFSAQDVTLLEDLAERTAVAIDNARLYLESREAVVARDTFLSVASHELKTPLTSILLQLQMSRRNAALKGEAASYTAEKMKTLIDQTSRQIRRLSRLIDDMLDISRIASGKLAIWPAHMDLRELAIEITDKLAPVAAEHGCTLRLESNGPVHGNWDEFRLEQVLNNLLTNAFRYGNRSAVAVRVWEEADHAYFSVRDQGKGIAKADQERIFHRFERAISENEVSGFGIGLYIAREIIGLHQGTIELESELHQGSTFTVKLPKRVTPLP